MPCSILSSIQINILTYDSSYFQCGVIECVPDSKSRDQIGKQTDISLDEYFAQKYGEQDSPKFQEVYSEFYFSCFSKIAYILWALIGSISHRLR